MERLYQFILSLSSSNDIFWVNLFHCDPGSLLESTLCPEMKPPELRRMLGEHTLFFISPREHELPLRALLRVIIAVHGAAAVALSEAERANCEA